jgi:hypothetical protein
MALASSGVMSIFTTSFISGSSSVTTKALAIEAKHR